MTASVHIVSGAVWIAGRFVETDADLDVGPALSGVRAEISVAGLFAGDRIPRADRVTQLGALALARATRTLAPRDSEGVAVITASVLATADTNERFERRRMALRPPEPRAFPYTAPNAAAGEFSIALRAHGPTLALVGGHEVALAAIERASRWIVRGMASRVIVVATECPPPTARVVSPPGVDPVECAAAVVLEAADPEVHDDHVVMRYVREGAAGAVNASPLLSVGPVAALWFASRDLRPVTLRIAAAAGAWIEACVGVGARV